MKLTFFDIEGNVVSSIAGIDNEDSVDEVAPGVLNQVEEYDVLWDTIDGVPVSIPASWFKEFSVRFEED